MSNPALTPNVRVNFQQRADYPLVKTKFGIFNSGLVPVRRYERDLDHFAEVSPESLRIDLWWGGLETGWTTHAFDGAPGNIVYDFAEIDRLAVLLNQVNVLPYWSYCYMPKPLQNPPGEYRSVPRDMQLWGKLLADYVRHSLDGGPQAHIGYHEIYNEPDNDYFFLGSLQDYLQLYDAGVRAIRQVDPTAVVGGPALAFSEDWIAPFLDYVQQNKLPLDFFSFHFYASKDEMFGANCYGGRNFLDTLALVRRHFQNRPELATTELHLNEFNSFAIDYPQGGVQDRYSLAAYLLHDYKLLVERPDITLVHWAQFLDSGWANFSGMVTIEGFRKAVFNGYQVYTRMPVDRVAVEVLGSKGIEAMASADASRAAAAMWNLSGERQQVSVHLANVPFAAGTLKVYRIDSRHCSFGDNHTLEKLAPCEVRECVATADLTWTGEIEHECVVYLELDDVDAPVQFPAEPPGNVLRVLHYYPDRQSRAYADFDKTTWTARLAMAGERQADMEVGVCADQLPAQIRVTTVVEGGLQKLDANSLLGVRVDYGTGGTYAKGVLYHGPYQGGVDLHDYDRTAPTPWGTRAAPDEVVAVDDFADFVLQIKAKAPADWDGRVQILTILQNAGESARVKMTFAAV
jgi:xylan 1,4-beta-xylosidase